MGVLFGYLIVFPAGWSEFNLIDWSEMFGEIFAKMLYAVISTTFLAYLFNIYALKIISPATASSYIYLQPLLASLFAIWMGKDNLTVIKIIAMALIFTGVYMVSKSGYKKA